jgi:hypothetical protein
MIITYWLAIVIYYYYYYYHYHDDIQNPNYYIITALQPAIATKHFYVRGGVFCCFLTVSGDKLSQNLFPKAILFENYERGPDP